MSTANSNVINHSTPADYAPPATLEARLEILLTGLTDLMVQAENIAAALLDSLMQKVRQRQPVFPGELIHICRGLHVLAKCGAELHRITRKGTPRITAEQVAQLEAKLRQAFAA
jgi:hypothetical protein